MNGTLSEEKDVANILALMHDLGWSPPAQLNSGAERRAFASKMIKVAQRFERKLEKSYAGSLTQVKTPTATDAP